MTFKAKITSILVLILLVIMAATAWNRGSSLSEPITIGAILSLTGNGAAYGQPAQRGMELAIQDINERGGIGGRKLTASYEDSKFDPTTALSAYQSLRARGIRAVVTNGSSVSVAIRKPVIDNHDFQMEVAAVTPLFSDGEPNTCRFTLTAPVAGRKLGGFITDSLHPVKFATLTLNDDYGTAMAQEVAQVVKEGGVEVVGSESFDKNSSDFRTQITKLSSLSPDVLLVVPAAGQAPVIFKQLKELNWKGVIVSDSWTIANDNLKDRSLVEGVYFVNYDWNGGDYATGDNLVSTFKKKYHDRYGTDAPVVAANAYDSVELIAQAINAVGTNDPEKIGMWLSSHVRDYYGVTGLITLNNDCEASRSAVIQQVKGGEFVKLN